MPKVTNEKGQVVWRENTGPAETWTVDQGTVKIVQRRDDGTERVTAAYQLKPGEKVD